MEFFKINFSNNIFHCTMCYYKTKIRALLEKEVAPSPALVTLADCSRNAGPNFVSTN